MSKDITFAVEAKDTAQRLGSSVIPGTEVDETSVHPFALYAVPANADAAEVSQRGLQPGSAPPSPKLPSAVAAPDISSWEGSARATAVPGLPVDALTEVATRAAADAAARAVAEAVETLERERVRMLQGAQEEAARCLAQAQEQTSTLSEAAYQQGFRQGEEAALRAASAQFAPIVHTFQHATEELARLRAMILQQAEDDVIDLAFQLARKIIVHEVLEHHHVLQGTLKRALAQVADQDQLVIRVHPDDLAQATKLQHDLLGSLADIKSVSLQADMAIGRGGCLVETTLGTIDARIDAQIEELEQRFRGQHLLDMQARVA